MSLSGRSSVTAAVVLLLAASCREPESEKLASSQAALAAKEIYGTYERKTEPYPGALASIALLPGACDPKQAPIEDKADGAVFATFYTECADPKCTSWKTADFSGSYRIVPGEGNLAKVQIDVADFDWGVQMPVFKGVVENLNVKYTLFLPDGTPCRASVNLKMKQANTLLNKKDAQKANKGAEDETVAPSSKMRCASAGCECAGQAGAKCSGSWACIDHACVCQSKPQ